MKKTKRNLRINSETIRNISDTELKDVVGGVRTVTVCGSNCHASECWCVPSNGSTC